MASNPRIDDLRKRLEKDPGSRLFAQLAEELRKEGDLAEAIRACRDGLQKHPTYPSARMTLGRALMDTGDRASARPEFEAVLKGAPDNILASRFLAECLEGLGDLAGAAARYKATLGLAPGDKQVQARLQDVEARLAAPPPAPAPVAEEVAAAAMEPEPVPIPLATVQDDSFELERAFEGPGTGAVAPPPMPPTRLAAPPMAATPSGGEPATAQPEPAPIPLAAVEDDSFELERAYEAPVTPAGPPRVAPEPPPVPPPPPPAEAQPSDFEFEMPPAATLPFQPTPRISLEEAAAASARPAPPPTAPAPTEEIASPTLAELYFNQGFTERAIEVYRQLLQREPGNERARARLKELEAFERHLRGEGAQPAVAAAGAPQGRREAIERTITRLEGLLVALGRRG